jgi:hypothetical protein
MQYIKVFFNARSTRMRIQVLFLLGLSLLMIANACDPSNTIFFWNFVSKLFLHRKNDLFSVTDITLGLGVGVIRALTGSGEDSAESDEEKRK